MQKNLVCVLTATLMMANILLADMDWTELTLRATAGGQQNAFMELEKQLYNLTYDATRTIGDYLQRHPDRTTRLQDMLIEYRVLTKNYLTDGTVEYVYHLPLTNMIMELLIPETGTVKLIVPMLCPCCGQDWPVEKPVPEGIDLVPKQIEPAAYSGIIIDCRHVPLTPCLFPTIEDPAGETIYSIDYAQKSAVIERGLVHYTTGNTVSAPQAGNTPLMIQARGVRGANNTDIVIATDDALRIHGSQNNLDLLKECRVVIIADF